MDHKVAHVQKVEIFLLLLIFAGMLLSPANAASNSTNPLSGVDLPVAPNREAVLATCGLGRVAFMQDHLDEAVARFSECLKFDPSLPHGYLLRGQPYLEKAKAFASKPGQVLIKHQTVEYFGKAIALGYNEPDIFKVRGETLAEIGETQLVIQELRQAAQQYKLNGLNYDYSSTLDDIKQLEKRLK